MALRLQASGLATIALIADRVPPTVGFGNVHGRLRRRPTRDHVHVPVPPPCPSRSLPDHDESRAFNLEVARVPDPGMATSGSASHDNVPRSAPGATQGECFDADMAALAACVGAGGSEKAVFHLHKMRWR